MAHGRHVQGASRTWSAPGRRRGRDSVGVLHRRPPQVDMEVAGAMFIVSLHAHVPFHVVLSPFLALRPCSFSSRWATELPKQRKPRSCPGGSTHRAAPAPAIGELLGVAERPDLPMVGCWVAGNTLEG